MNNLKNAFTYLEIIFAIILICLFIIPLTSLYYNSIKGLEIIKKINYASIFGKNFMDVTIGYINNNGINNLLKQNNLTMLKLKDLVKLKTIDDDVFKYSIIFYDLNKKDEILSIKDYGLENYNNPNINSLKNIFFEKPENKIVADIEIFKKENDFYYNGDLIKNLIFGLDFLNISLKDNSNTITIVLYADSLNDFNIKIENEFDNDVFFYLDIKERSLYSLNYFGQSSFVSIGKNNNVLYNNLIIIVDIFDEKLNFIKRIGRII